MSARAGRRHRVVMVATSYPRFPGDTVGTFMEPIAHEVARRGHDVHLVAPWHPAITRPAREGGVAFHFFRYAPHPALNVFGYAAGLREDVRLRGSSWLAAPLALTAGAWTARRVAREVDATIVHGHWVIPGGAMAVAAAASRPLVVSLHGSDVFVAERHALVRVVARRVFARAAWVTACSADLRDRALGLGARASQSEVIPYGVDPARFGPNPEARARLRAALGLDAGQVLVFAVGRLVRKKGFEYLVDATAHLARSCPGAVVAIAGSGDLAGELRERAGRVGAGDHLRWLGLVAQDAVADWLAAADVAVVPSIRDDAGNVDGLPNVVMEALASATPLVTTLAGGIGAVVRPGTTAEVVPERDAEALSAAITRLAEDPARRRVLGRAAREDVVARFSWAQVAERLEAVYDRVAPAS
jgi:glycosyltransferase involved in cell wall biosynthesis